MSVKSSSKLKKVLEVRLRPVLLCFVVQSEIADHSVDVVKIVLAFGNYMNSSKRGLASGFRLQSLDLVSANTAEYCRVLREYCRVLQPH